MISIEQKKAAFDWLIDQAAKGTNALPIEAAQFSDSDWALLLESVANEHRLGIWQSIPQALQSQVLAEMRGDARNLLASQLSSSSLNTLARESSSEDLIEILDVLPNKTVAKIIKKLPAESQVQAEESLAYKESEIGRYASKDVYTAISHASVGAVLSELKEIDLPAYTDSITLVNESGLYVGEVDLNAIFSAKPEQLMENIIAANVQVINAKASLINASDQVKSSGRSMLPIVNDDNKLIGRFSLKDALDVFQEHYEAQLSHMGNVSDEDLFAPTLLSARRRAVWLGINLITAFMASFVIGVFDQVVAQVVALAVLMPIVASMGGITGSQTLTLTIRGLATNQLSQSNFKVLGKKEVQIAFLNGLLWASVVAIITGYWFDSLGLSLIIAFALVINMAVASFSGVIIPIIMDKMGIDPALAGSVVLTTVTDVVGFFVFLGSAAIILV
ncbi:magnesium transporter [Saccharobesus litoralis]|uniref:Magnesium transporter n=1 Tax=Saccharobesus litoralis TaxID=2172099 RepID=A0A2S0VLN7_9ALTE|nr:magnesium transporter [Saccharobesus litoralis]AWB65111.1 magnesium transporter [Saccharobesus litoralis]